jgi:DNA processing protein
MKLATPAQLDELLSPLACTKYEDLEVLLAHATLSQLCEPSDASAGELAQALGAVNLVTSIIRTDSPRSVRERLTPDQLENIEQAFNQSFEQLWADGLERWRPRAIQSEVFHKLRIFGDLNGKLVAPSSSIYPRALDDLGGSRPHVLWLRGNTSFLSEPLKVGLVGSRNATAYGKRVAIDLAATAVANKIITVSGGAYGIDALVHQATLADGGETIAVMAGGLDSLYPSGNQQLFLGILNAGLLVSEVPPGVTPTKWRFLQRNRLIAALSKATVVIEAGHHSGALNTAKHAISLDRPVGVIPGPITSATSYGCNELARLMGANVLVMSSTQDMPYLCTSRVRPSEKTQDSPGSLETRAFDAIGGKSLGIATIQKSAGLSSAEARIAIDSLLKSRRIVELGGRYKRTQTTL